MRTISNSLSSLDTVVIGYATRQQWQLRPADRHLGPQNAALSTNGGNIGPHRSILKWQGTAAPGRLKLWYKKARSGRSLLAQSEHSKKPKAAVQWSFLVKMAKGCSKSKLSDHCNAANVGFCRHAKSKTNLQIVLPMVCAQSVSSIDGICGLLGKEGPF